MQSLSAASNGQATPAGCAHELLDAVPPVLWFIRRSMRKYRGGLSVPQFRTLASLRERPKMSLSALADVMGASLPTTSRTVTGLVQRKLVARVASDDDRRQLVLSLTAKGRSVLKIAIEWNRDQLAVEMEKLDEDDRQCIQQAMHALKRVFGSVHCHELAGDTCNDAAIKEIAAKN